MAKLAIFGGVPIRTKPFMSQPLIDETERRFVEECLEKKAFSRFIGSPVGDFRNLLAMESSRASDMEDLWSVLGGKYVRLFEAEFSSKHQIRFSISMNSATSCLTAASLACGLKSGDEVITTPFSFTATATGLHAAGVKVVFADIDPDTYCLDPLSVKEKITNRTKAVVPVYILGNAGGAADIFHLCSKNGLVLIEDSAQALHSKLKGSYLGTLGKVGVFSFQETKNIMTGEGGMAITNDEETAYRLRLIRNHGEAMVFRDDRPERIATAVGFNFRLPEILAAIGYAQVLKMEKLNLIRRKNYLSLKMRLEEFNFLTPQRITNDIGEFYPYCVGYRYYKDLLGIGRDLFAMALRAEGIPVTTGFPRLLNENLLFEGDAFDTSMAKKLNYEEYLGFFQIGNPNTPEDMTDIGNAVAKIYENRDELIKGAKKIKISREFNSGRS